MRRRREALTVLADFIGGAVIIAEALDLGGAFAIFTDMTGGAVGVANAGRSGQAVTLDADLTGVAMSVDLALLAGDALGVLADLVVDTMVVVEALAHEEAEIIDAVKVIGTIGVDVAFRLYGDAEVLNAVEIGSTIGVHHTFGGQKLALAVDADRVDAGAVDVAEAFGDEDALIVDAIAVEALVVVEALYVATGIVQADRMPQVGIGTIRIVDALDGRPAMTSIKTDQLVETIGITFALAEKLADALYAGFSMGTISIFAALIGAKILHADLRLGAVLFVFTGNRLVLMAGLIVTMKTQWAVLVVFTGEDLGAHHAHALRPRRAFLIGVAAIHQGRTSTTG